MPLAANVTVDSTTWAALALVLTVIGAALTWVLWRRRGVAAGLRGLAWTLLPVAAWLTGTLKLVANIVNDVVNWASRLVFSPTVWAGVSVAGLAVLLWIVSGVLRARGVGTRRPPKSVPAAKPGPAPVAASPAKDAPKTAKKRGKADDDIEDMDDIEATLKRHGI